MPSPQATFRDGAGKALTDYPRPSVAVDTALLTVPDGSRGLGVLVVRRSGSYEGGAWALPGTFLHEGERLADAVLRALAAKAGVRGAAPRQLHVFDDPDRDERGWVLSVAHVDALPWARIAPATGREDVRVIPVQDAHGLPFDHDAILAMAVTTLREAYTEHPDPHHLLGAEEFTLYQLRRLHEAVAGRPLPKDTFRRRMQPHLTPTDRLAEGEVGKPARLYVRGSAG